jgi:hypothetical protein
MFEDFFEEVRAYGGSLVLLAGQTFMSTYDGLSTWRITDDEVWPLPLGSSL